MKRVFLSMILAAAFLGGCTGGSFLEPTQLSPSAPQGEDDMWTICLMDFRYPGHNDQAKHYKEQTEAFSGWKNLYIVDYGSNSKLFWGKYNSEKDAQHYIVKAKEWETPYKIKPYTLAKLELVPGREVGNPAYDLKSAPGVYTVVIAVFTDVPERNLYGRKKWAAQYVDELRKAGEEGYFYHGPGQSVVCVGVFGAGAVKEVQKVAPGYRPGPASTPMERLMQQLTAPTITENQIVDERVRKILAKHPYLAENGYAVSYTVADINARAPTKYTNQSYLSPIPGRLDENGNPIVNDSSSAPDRSGNP